MWTVATVLAGVAAAAAPAGGALPLMTLLALEDLYNQGGGGGSAGSSVFGWATTCGGWAPGSDPCQPPWGLPNWVAPSWHLVDDSADDDVPVFGNTSEVCFVCGDNGTTLLAVELSTACSSAGSRFGVLPASIGGITSLTWLGMASCNFGGPIPSALGNLTALTYLNLDSNFLTGPVPASLGRLPALRVFTARRNELSGTLSNELSALTSLTMLELSVNNISGRFPPWLVSLPLQSLLLGGNILGGTLPDAMGNLSATISVLSLGGNSFSGPIPPSLGKCTLLTELWLDNNAFSGSLPDSVGNLTRLVQLSVRANSLTGPLPASLGALTGLKNLQVGQNSFTGMIPDLSAATALQQLFANNNQLSGPLPDWIGRLAALTDLSLDSNLLNSSIPLSIGNLTRMTYLALFQNRLTGEIPTSLVSLTRLGHLGLWANRLSGSIPPSVGNMTNLTILLLANNQLEGTVPATLGALTRLTFLSMKENRLTGTIPDVFVGLTQLQVFDMSMNQLNGSVPASLFTAFGGNSDTLSVLLYNNSLESVGPVLSGCESLYGSLVVDLSNNAINGSLDALLNSATICSSSLTIIMDGNNITQLPPRMLYGISSLAANNADEVQYGNVVMQLSRNPIVRIHPLAFDAGPSGKQFAWLGTLSLQLSDSTAGPIDVPNNLSFSGVKWSRRTGGRLDIGLSNTGSNVETVRSLSAMSNAPKYVAVDLSSNGITEIPSGVCHTSCMTSLDLSNNAISTIAVDAFVYTFDLWELVLSHNNLTVLRKDVLGNLPALATLMVNNNSLVALPISSNHIAVPEDAAGNPLQCDSYGAAASGCTCPSGLVANTHCNFVRCTATASGCTGRTIENSTDCSNAPWSECVDPASVAGEFYYDNRSRSFVRVIECANMNELSGLAGAAEGTPGAFVWYEVAEFTATTNRICSLCSSCPSGFHTTPCTPTSNTRCTKAFSLSRGAIAGIVSAVMLPAAGLVIALLFIRYRTVLKTTRNELGETRTYLQLTERLLGDERDEKELLEQGWSIAETDLTFGRIVGEGSFGRVFAGAWGHIPVAIKVLRHPVDDLDETSRADFDHEVKFMRSLRHPNLLIFYGAGVDQSGRAFLVTELMTGSLKSVLRDHTRPLSWRTRLGFAEDVARGMAYLHDRGAVHRDLKADNIFYDSDLRVKVADFGTGRIAARMKDASAADDQDRFDAGGAAVDAGRTLSKGVGSLLWMGPEALRGAAVKGKQASALDVYSYAVVLFEVWTRGRPWDEVTGDGVEFIEALVERVCGGERPRLPPGCQEAPPGYRELMERCWAAEPADRPPFAQVLDALQAIGRRMSTKMGESAL